MDSITARVDDEVHISSVVVIWVELFGLRSLGWFSKVNHGIDRRKKKPKWCISCESFRYLQDFLDGFLFLKP